MTPRPSLAAPPRRLWARLALLSALAAVTPAQAADPIKVGLVASLTSDFALIGVLQKNAGVMAVDEFNAAGGVGDRPVSLLVEDGANSNTVALGALNKVLSEKPVAVLAPIWSTQLLAMFPTLEKEGVPTLSTTGTRKVTQLGNRWYFRYFPHDGITKAAAAEFAINGLGKKKVGILYVANEYGQSGRDIIVETLKKHGLAPVAMESHNATDKDMSAQLDRLKRAGADVIISQAHPADTALILKQQRQLGLEIPHVASSAASQPAMLKLVTEKDLDGVYVETAYVPAIDPRPEVQRWMKAYAERFKTTPDVFAILYYDMARMALAAVKDSGGDREKTRRWLETHRYEGLAATYVCDAEHNCNHKAVIIRYDGKTPKIVKTYDYTPK
jgi:branched-chain amino acid transport system substrate-binding protein